MEPIYTGITETEMTPTGVITREKVTTFDKGRRSSWRIIGYTSISVNSEGKKRFEGAYGRQLAQQLAAKYA